MSTEKLIKPRWKVIASFPDSEYKVGDIEDRDWSKYVNGEDESDGVLWRISDFPHLFKHLEWWEDRKIEEMPKYLKADPSWSKYFVAKVKDYYGENNYVRFEYDGNIPQQCDSNKYYTEWFLISSEEEYNTYISTLQK